MNPSGPAGNDPSNRTAPSASAHPAVGTVLQVHDPRSDRSTLPTQPASVRRRTRRGRIGIWLRRLALLALLVVAGLMALVVVYRYAVPAHTPVMLARQLSGETVVQQWVPLEQISPRLVRAVLASEDARFCSHRGIDFGELRAAIEEAKDGNPRGASTISMQLVKNLFLWPDRSYVRKAVELPLTLWLELVWPKRRILEVYLNIAEWGPGVYGIEAAARRSFGKPASDLTASEAARLAVVLPNPRERDARRPSRRVETLSQIVARRARFVNARCLD